jgi:hypothetical protein
MKLNRRGFLIGTTGLLFTGCSSSGGGGGGSVPSSKFELGKWRIQLPVNDAGNFSGSMKIVNPARTVKPWFIASQDKLEFTCPAKGATSPGSKSPRTELAENNTWFLEKGGTLSAILTVNEIPSGGGMCVGQVWQRDQALRLVVYPDGSIFADGNYIDSALVAKVPLGTSFTYRAVVKGMILTLDINGARVWERDVSAWVGQKMYFKAGAYCGAANVADPKALFKATFTDLKISH